MELYSDRLQEYCARIERAIPSYLPSKNPLYGTLTEAMAYACEGGGKRLRPVLMLEWTRLCGGDPYTALPFACALEMIHSYSLVHDDLPCMDNSPLRRGKPSTHKAFGEDIALLAGDALLNRSFEVCLSAENRKGLSEEAVLKATALLAETAGIHGMIGGQAIDLQSEGKTIDLTVLEKLQEGKTAALLRAACKMGAILGGGDAEKCRIAEDFGREIGLCFQIVDDILDVTSTEDVLGKPIGGDADLEKSTYVSILGIERARKLAEQRTDTAVRSLDAFGDEAEDLRRLAQSLLNRNA